MTIVAPIACPAVVQPEGLGVVSLRKPETSDFLELLGIMQLIREAETKLAQLFADGEIPGFIHLSVGQEAVAAGVVSALEREDTLASNHRGHGHAIAKGIDLDRFFLEVMGKAEGICKGRGGSMHVADMSVGMLGANGIVAAGLPIAVGSALAHQLKRTRNVAAVFFGDGALAEGVLHESFNLAAIWKLPVLFVCENNGWSEFSPTSRQFAADAIRLAGAFAISGKSVEGNNVLEVAAAARELVGQIREGGGPRLLECRTYRVRGHFEGDPQKYRDAKDLGIANDSDPIDRLVRLSPDFAVSGAEIETLQRSVTERVANAINKARAGTAPPFESAHSDVYTQPGAGGS
jgi:pyruvate dehydrogenase E1 component alpha subunit